jgi:DNA-binding transcriptional regulator YdaS (Cro superfamily)
MVAMHSCDNPRCNNPAHLSWGTSAENNADRDAKGRAVHRLGDNHPLATLTAAEVTYIRLSSGKSDRQLAEELGKSASAVSQARLGQCWRHLPAPPKYNGVAKGGRCATAKLTEADVIRIRVSREDAAKLALELGVSPSAVTRARNGTDWGHVTAAEPVRDGQVRGERVRQAKLNERLVRELRASSLSHNELAKRYGIHASVICRVRNRKAWAHVT